MLQKAQKSPRSGENFLGRVGGGRGWGGTGYETANTNHLYISRQDALRAHRLLECNTL